MISQILGLHNLGNKFNESKIQIDKIRRSLVTELKAQKDNVNTKNNTFKQEMEDKSKMVANNKEDLIEYTHSTLKGIYYLINNEKEKWILVEIDESPNDIGDSFFYHIKKSISLPLIHYYELIEKYVKLFFRILFSVIMAINAIIVANISIKAFFNIENILIPNSCLICIMKSLIHIFWNV